MVERILLFQSKQICDPRVNCTFMRENVFNKHSETKKSVWHLFLTTSLLISVWSLQFVQNISVAMYVMPLYKEAIIEGWDISNYIWNDSKLTAVSPITHILNVLILQKRLFKATHKMYVEQDEWFTRR